MAYDGGISSVLNNKLTYKFKVGKYLDAPARVNYPEALGLRHLAFKVKSVDDTVKELNAKGITTEPVRLDDYTGKKMTFFHDPDNLPLEIHE